MLQVPSFLTLHRLFTFKLIASFSLLKIVKCVCTSVWTQLRPFLFFVWTTLKILLDIDPDWLWFPFLSSKTLFSGHVNSSSFFISIQKWILAIIYRYYVTLHRPKEVKQEGRHNGEACISLRRGNKIEIKGWWRGASRREREWGGIGGFRIRCTEGQERWLAAHENERKSVVSYGGGISKRR